jgi:flagellar biosynthesis/type III secretory pathway chaperone
MSRASRDLRRMNATSASSASADAAVDALIRTMTDQAKVYRLLRECLERKREALRAARIAEIQKCCDAEQHLIGRIEQLEHRRAEQAEAAARAVAPESPGGLSVSELAHRLDDRRAGVLRQLADELKATVKEAAEVSRVVAGAAETLSRHLAGIVQTVHGALSRVGVYGKSGRLAVGSQTEYSVDVRS